MNKLVKNETFRKILVMFLGDKEDFTTENQLLHFSLILISFVYVFSIIHDIIMKLPILLTIINSLTLLIFIGLYFFSRFYRYFVQTVISFFTIILLSFSFSWFLKGGVQGGLPFFFLCLLAYIILLTEKTTRIILVMLFFINITSLFLIEFYHPELVTKFPTRWLQFENMYLMYIFCILLIGFLVYISKGLYKEEKKNTVELIAQYRKAGANLKNEYEKCIELLSVRERKVFELIIENKTNKEIAYALNISELTVKSHITSIYKKFEVKKRVDLINKK